MRLSKEDTIIQTLLETDSSFDFKRLKCWIKREDSYNIFIFSIQLENEDELLKVKDELRDYLAIFFQSQTLVKDVERWNIYQVYFVLDSVNLNTKSQIEQDKFATRKLIFDNVQKELSDIEIEEIIYNEIFAFSLQEKKIVKSSLLDDMDETSKEILSVIVKTKGDINNLLIQLCDEQN